MRTRQESRTVRACEASFPPWEHESYYVWWMVTIELDVNGERTEVAFAPHKTLLEVLREDLNLTGTKHGCELGECGTCTVLLDGTPVLSCLVLGLACADHRVKTVEGMAQGARLHPLQETFADLGAAQCGYCTPAFLLAAEALLTASRNAGVQQPHCEIGRAHV